MNDLILTKQGLEELKAELNKREIKTRKKIANEIAKAREQGDLSENAAYTAALEDKNFNETRIEELKKMIANAKVKQVNKQDKKVGIGEKFTLKRVEDDKEFTYMLVGESESDPIKRKITINSPIGKVVNGKKLGDKIKVTLPNRVETYLILKIS
jgi:transcription elongation factor GreA